MLRHVPRLDTAIANAWGVCTSIDLHGSPADVVGEAWQVLCGACPMLCGLCSAQAQPLKSPLCFLLPGSSEDGEKD